MTTNLDMMAMFHGKTITISVTAERSRWGTPQPTLRIRGFHPSDFRRERAALHALAALAEIATPNTAAWVVVLEDRRVYLELAEGSEEEADAGLRFLGGLLA
jgi:hypothetical protein